MMTKKKVERKKNAKDGNEIMAVADATKTCGRKAGLRVHDGWMAAKAAASAKAEKLTHAVTWRKIRYPLQGGVA